MTLEVLAAHLAQYPSGEDGLVFTTSRGEPWRRTAFGEAIRSARTAAGLPDGVSFHDLRHHFASVLIAAGCSIKAVQSALGHANASETLDAYSHLWPADEDRIRDAIENVHGAACHRCVTSRHRRSLTRANTPVRSLPAIMSGRLGPGAAGFLTT